MTDTARASIQLPDQSTRDVITAAKGQFDTTVFADAGAGTGKTTALVTRVANLVSAGVPVTRIAAITFNEAAAAELHHRVRTTLEQRRATASRQDDVAAAQRMHDALSDLDDATFSTLHAFAHRILADHPLQAGIAPGFEVLDELERDAQFERRWDEWLVDLATDPDVRPVLEHMQVFGVTTRKLRRLVRAMLGNEERIPSRLATRPGPWQPPTTDAQPALDHLDRVDEIMAECTDPDDKLYVRLVEVVAVGRRLRAWATVGGNDFGALLDIARDLQEALKLGSGGRQAAWPEWDGAKAVRDEVKLLKPLLEAMVSDHAHALLTELAGWSAWFLQQWRRQRHADATLTFSDLLVDARDLLRDDAAVRNDVAGRYDHLLIDEFQDTDPVQVELAMLLAATNADTVAEAADESGRIDWQLADPVAGRLFFVGDPKQSIYRFRGADISVYEGVKDFITDGPGTLEHLTHNFRSVPGVIAWVNAVFGTLIEPRALAQPAYEPLTTARPVIDDQTTAVRWFGGNSDLAAQQQRSAQSSDVVRVITGIVGRDQVEDPVTGGTRAARHADIAVLVRRHATARQLERELEDAGIPHVVEARSLVYGTDEVRDLSSILTALDDPTDHVAVLAALRHPAFGCSDGDLVSWRTGGGWWTPPDDPDDVPVPEGLDDDHQVAVALRRLAELRADRIGHTVGGYVEHVIERLDLMEIALVHRRFRDRWRRLRFAADQAHAWHEAGGHLRGFVRWLREQDVEDVAAPEHVVVDPDDDAVRITTVHAAKGMEYPVVVMLGLDMKVGRGLHDPTVVFTDDGTVDVNLGSNLKTDGYLRQRDGDAGLVGAREHHGYEQLRLAYVAATRARDVLVVSLHHNDDDAMAAHLQDTMAHHEDLWVRQELVDPPHEPTAAPPAWQGGGDPVAEYRQWQQAHRSAADAATLPTTLAATTIAEMLAAHDDTDTRDRRDAAASSEGPRPRPAATGTQDEGRVDGDGHAWQRGRAGSATGRAVHGVLEVIDLATLDDLGALARTQCAAEGLPIEDAAGIAARVRRAAEAPIVARALRAGNRTWRELHVGAPIPRDPADPSGDTVTVEGFIDLLAEIDDDLVVVDWKTDTAATRTPEQVARRYHPQAATYALALETVLDRHVDRCVFVLTGVADRQARQVEVTGPVLDQAKQQLRAVLSRIGR